MNELTHVPLSSPTLSSLDLVSSARALLKTQLGSFDPKQVPLSSEVDGKVTDIQSKAQLTRDEAKVAADEAKKVGVDLAKSGFFSKLASVAFAGIALGVSIAATILTGGAGVPLLIASGVAFTLAVADAGCAFADWRSKAAGGEGLAMGSDSIANALNILLSKMGVNDDRAQWWGKAVSISSRVALAVGTLWSAVVSPPSLPAHIAGTVNMVNMARRSAEPVVEGVIGLVNHTSTKVLDKLKGTSQNKSFEAEVSSVKAYQLRQLQASVLTQQGNMKLSEVQLALKESQANEKTAQFDAEIRMKQSERFRGTNQTLQQQLAEKEGLLLQSQNQFEQLQSRFDKSNVQLSGVMQQLQMLQQQLAELQPARARNNSFS
jgi:secreted effector protein SseF